MVKKFWNSTVTKTMSMIQPVVRVSPPVLPVRPFFLSSLQSESQNISSAAHERPRSPFLAQRNHTHELKLEKKQSKVSKKGRKDKRQHVPREKYSAPKCGKNW